MACDLLRDMLYKLAMGSLLCQPVCNTSEWHFERTQSSFKTYIEPIHGLKGVMKKHMMHFESALIKQAIDGLMTIWVASSRLLKGPLKPFCECQVRDHPE